MEQGHYQVHPCAVSTCTRQGKVPLCSGELHLCNDHFDCWVMYLRENPLQVEKWSTENFAAWDQHFNQFVDEQVQVHSPF